jgi:hypothetical protein
MHIFTILQQSFLLQNDGFNFFDIIAGPSGREVISLQKEDSLLVFEYNGELKRFLRCRFKEIQRKNLQN